MSATSRTPRPAPRWWIPPLCLLLAAVFWYARILSPGEVRTPSIVAPGSVGGSQDLYIEHHPMAHYGFGALRTGRLPLWNPYQLCGMPFFAIPHTGLLYFGNLPHLLLETSVATEVVYVLHLALAALGMWLLVIDLGLGRLAGAAAAASFAWSGWMTYQANQAALVSGMSWLPLLVLAVERSLRGGRVAPFALALVVAAQALNGAPETFAYNLLLAGLFAGYRLAGRAHSHGPASAASAGLGLLVCITAGVLLSAVQLLPSLELVSLSGRAEPLDLHQVRPARAAAEVAIAPAAVLEQWLGSRGKAAAGLLPVLALVLGPPRERGLWLFALATAGAASLLVFGGAVFELYYRSPLGGYFRHPVKFLQVFAFAQGLLAALAVRRLEQWCSPSPPPPWRRSAWRAGCALLAAALVFLLARGAPILAPAAAWLLLVLFGVVPQRLRGAVLGGLVALHASVLFATARNGSVRPVLQPGVFDAQATGLARLGEAARDERIFLGHFINQPAFTPKQGILRGIRVVTDYEPLAMERYARYFRRAAGAPPLPRRRLPYEGVHALGPESRWHLMDLASTRLYAVATGGALDRALAPDGPARSAGVIDRPGLALEGSHVYERSSALPRARFAGRARLVDDADAALAALDAQDFDPATEVVLERGDAAPPELPSPPARGRARIVEDAPERVVVEVDADGPGLLVLADVHYPGWRAHAGDRELPIHRANHLFRAVAVPAGSTRVVFEYRPRSLSTGALVSGATALGLCGAAALRWRTGRRRPGAILSTAPVRRGASAEDR